MTDVKRQRDLLRRLATIQRARSSPSQIPRIQIGVLELTLEIMIAAGALRAKLQHDDLSGIRDIEPDVVKVIDAVDALMNRLAS